jgi:citrate lyase subunit beta / citryl-CoA lyase
VNEIICGVDVAKHELVAALEDGRQLGCFANEAEGIGGLIAVLRACAVGLTVVEATGGLERRLVLLLAEAGCGVAVADPRRVRLFAEAMGGREKTDRIDAVMIAAFALVNQPMPMTPPSPAQQRLTRLVRRLGQVTADLSAHKNRVSSADDAEIIASLGRVMAALRAEARMLEGEVASLIDDDPLWVALAQEFTTVKGVAGRTVARLMADLPEIGTYNGKAIAKLVGLAPMANDSGQRKGRRIITGGGRGAVRCILFLVARGAVRFHGGLGDFHYRLVAAGKPLMVIRIALARKLLVIRQRKSTRRAHKPRKCNLTHQIVPPPARGGVPLSRASNPVYVALQHKKDISMPTIRPRRSALYMPGSNARALEKARGIAADVLILDLEDAVAPDAKVLAREQVAAAVKAGGYGRRELVIRVNAPDTEWFEADINAAMEAGPSAILVPKVADVETLDMIGRRLAVAGASVDIRIWAMIETAQAILDIERIAKAARDRSTRLSCLVLGLNDLAKETRARFVPGRAPMLGWMSQALLAARAHGLDILDGVYNTLTDEAGFLAECAQARDMGFDGKTLIHPGQVAIANTVFSPSPDEIESARAIIALFGLPENAGKGALQLNGRMVERLHAEMARRVVALAEVAESIF